MRAILSIFSLSDAPLKMIVICKMFNESLIERAYA